MKDLREKARSGPDAVRFQDAKGESFVIMSPALYDPAEVSPKDEYPELGEWLETDDGFLECPRQLAAEIVAAVDNNDVGFPALVEIDSAKLADGEWRVETTIEEAE